MVLFRSIWTKRYFISLLQSIILAFLLSPLPSARASVQSSESEEEYRGCQNVEPSSMLIRSPQYDSSVSTLSHRTVVKFSCPAEFDLLGPTQEECSNGEWVPNVRPTCKPDASKTVLCPPLRVENGFVIGELFNKPLEVAQIGCDQDFFLFPPVNVICQSGAWQPVDGSEFPACTQPTAFCPSLPLAIPRGSGERSSRSSSSPPASIPLGTKISYQCEPGFRLVPLDSRVRMCLPNGTWTGSSPTCEVIGCDQPDSNSDAIWHQLGASEDGKFPVGTKVVYNCPASMRLNGASVLTCQSNGFWSAEFPYCLSFSSSYSMCLQPMPPDHGIVVHPKRGTLQQGATVAHICDPGFHLFGPEFRTCLPDGTWSGEDPQCVPVTTPGSNLVLHTLSSDVSGSLIIAAASAGAVLGLLLIALLVMLLYRHRACLSHPRYSPQRDQLPSVREDPTRLDQDRLALMAFADTDMPRLPTYEEALRQPVTVVAPCRADGQRGRPRRVNYAPTALGNGLHRTFSTSSRSTITSARSLATASLSEGRSQHHVHFGKEPDTFGSTETFPISDTTSTSVTVATVDSTDVSMTGSRRANAGSVASMSLSSGDNPSAGSEGAPLIDTDRSSAPSRNDSSAS